MACIRNYQRRKIEQVFENSFGKLLPEYTYLLSGKVLEFIGISPGVGTCSDLHNINIAVFGFKNGPPENKNPTRVVEVSDPTVRGLVLDRERREDETDPNIHAAVLPNCRVVEGLTTEAVDPESKQVHLKLTGKKELYPY